MRSVRYSPIYDRLYKEITLTIDKVFDECQKVNPSWRKHGTADRFNAAMRAALSDAKKVKYL